MTRKLNPCLRTPLTLYELAAAEVDQLELPSAFVWSVEDVADWIEKVVGLPEYRQCIVDNQINGRRLLMLEDPSHLPELNIRDFQHIKMITEKVREEYSVEFVRFARSVSLPARKPMAHCTWFKSRNGPNWGVRQNWTRCDIFRWMKIIMAEPVYQDHWDLVWYRKPEYPKVIFGNFKKRLSEVVIPHYKPVEEKCLEYKIPRKFRFQLGIPEDEQTIWMEHRTESFQETQRKNKKRAKKMKTTIPMETRLMPERVSLNGLRGKDLILAKRKMATPKFFV